MSEYWRLKREAREADGYWQRTLGLQSPWQNDYQPIAKPDDGDDGLTCRNGYKVTLNAGVWSRGDFARLGVIDFGNGRRIGWAWHADGRSIDREDRGFDLVGFSAPEADKPYHWLGRDAETVA